MGFWGFKRKELAKLKLPDNCIACGKAEKFIIASQLYVHFVYLPLFPFGKITSCSCSSCKKSYPIRDLPAAAQEQGEKLIKETKTPLRMWMGAIIIAILAIIIGFAMRGETKRNKKLLNDPRPGDLLEIMIESDRQYTLYRVDSVKSDTVFLRVADRNSTTQYGLNDLKEIKEDIYTGAVLAFTKDSLLQMLRDNIINGTDRKE